MADLTSFRSGSERSFNKSGCPDGSSRPDFCFCGDDAASILVDRLILSQYICDVKTELTSFL